MAFLRNVSKYLLFIKKYFLYIATAILIEKEYIVNMFLGTEQSQFKFKTLVFEDYV